ncbi:hypothetical protein BH11PAT2_BH11PAT2_06140 [soil metagenome]
MGFYASTVVVVILALRSPAEYGKFLDQNFEFWIVAEFLAIHSVGMFSGFSKVIPKFTQYSIFALYLLFLSVIAVVYQEWILGLFMVANLAIRFWRAKTAPSEVNSQIVPRTLIFLFTLFTFALVGGLITLLIPDYAATSDPVYMKAMNKVGPLGWVIEYYGFLTILGLWGLLKTLRSRGSILTS